MGKLNNSSSPQSMYGDSKSNNLINLINFCTLALKK